VAPRRQDSLLMRLAVLAALLLPEASAQAAGGTAVRCADELVFGAPRGARRVLPGRPSPRGASRPLHLCKADAETGESFFLVSYDRYRRAPLWTAYRLTRAEMEAAAVSGITRRRHGGAFQADPGLFRSGRKSLTGDDFRGAGRDRGHLVPAAAMAFDPSAYAATFTVANLALQDRRLNRGLWRRLEQRVRAWACDLGRVYVITGAAYGTAAAPAAFSPRGKPRVRVAVPWAFYKVVYDPAGGGRAIAFLHENVAPASGDLAAAILSIDALEEVTGMDFFPEMPAPLEAGLEAAAADPGAWHLSEPRPSRCLGQLSAQVGINRP
jgi:endonuclease G